MIKYVHGEDAHVWSYNNKVKLFLLFKVRLVHGVLDNRKVK